MCVKRSIAHVCIFQVIFRNRIVINCILELRKLGQRAVTDPELQGSINHMLMLFIFFSVFCSFQF